MSHKWTHLPILPFHCAKNPISVTTVTPPFSHIIYQRKTYSTREKSNKLNDKDNGTDCSDRLDTYKFNTYRKTNPTVQSKDPRPQDINKTLKNTPIRNYDSTITYNNNETTSSVRQHNTGRYNIDKGSDDNNHSSVVGLTSSNNSSSWVKAIQIFLHKPIEKRTPPVVASTLDLLGKQLLAIKSEQSRKEIHQESHHSQINHSQQTTNENVVREKCNESLKCRSSNISHNVVEYLDILNRFRHEVLRASPLTPTDRSAVYARCIYFLLHEPVNIPEAKQQSLPSDSIHNSSDNNNTSGPTASTKVDISASSVGNQTSISLSSSASYNINSDSSGTASPVITQEVSYIHQALGCLAEAKVLNIRLTIEHYLPFLMSRTLLEMGRDIPMKILSDATEAITETLMASEVMALAAEKMKDLKKRSNDKVRLKKTKSFHLYKDETVRSKARERATRVTHGAQVVAGASFAVVGLWVHALQLCNTEASFGPLTMSLLDSGNWTAAAMLVARALYHPSMAAYHSLPIAEAIATASKQIVEFQNSEDSSSGNEDPYSNDTEVTSSRERVYESKYIGDNPAIPSLSCSAAAEHSYLTLSSFLTKWLEVNRDQYTSHEVASPRQSLGHLNNQNSSSTSHKDHTEVIHKDTLSIDNHVPLEAPTKVCGRQIFASRKLVEPVIVSAPAKYWYMALGHFSSFAQEYNARMKFLCQFKRENANRLSFYDRGDYDKSAYEDVGMRSGTHPSYIMDDEYESIRLGEQFPLSIIMRTLHKSGRWQEILQMYNGTIAHSSENSSLYNTKDYSGGVPLRPDVISRASLQYNDDLDRKHILWSPMDRSHVLMSLIQAIVCHNKHVDMNSRLNPVLYRPLNCSISEEQAPETAPNHKRYTYRDVIAFIEKELPFDQYISHTHTTVINGLSRGGSGAPPGCAWEVCLRSLRYTDTKKNNLIDLVMCQLGTAGMWRQALDAFVGFMRVRSTQEGWGKEGDHTSNRWPPYAYMILSSTLARALNPCSKEHSSLTANGINSNLYISGGSVYGNVDSSDVMNISNNNPNPDVFHALLTLVKMGLKRTEVMNVLHVLACLVICTPLATALPATDATSSSTSKNEVVISHCNNNHNNNPLSTNKAPIATHGNVQFTPTIEGLLQYLSEQQLLAGVAISQAHYLKLGEHFIRQFYLVAKHYSEEDWDPYGRLGLNYIYTREDVRRTPKLLLRRPPWEMRGETCNTIIVKNDNNNNIRVRGDDDERECGIDEDYSSYSSNNNINSNGVVASFRSNYDRIVEAKRRQTEIIDNKWKTAIRIVSLLAVKSKSPVTNEKVYSESSSEELATGNTTGSQPANNYNALALLPTCAQCGIPTAFFF